MPLVILSIFQTPCLDSAYLFNQNSDRLHSSFILSIPSYPSTRFLCYDVGRLIPVLFCDAHGYLITHKQNLWTSMGVAWLDQLGRGLDYGNQCKKGRLITMWTATAAVPIRQTVSEIKNTCLLFAIPCLYPLSSSLVLKGPWTDIITVIITIYQADECRTKHSLVLLRCSIVLFFSAFSWFCHRGNNRQHQVYVNRPFGAKSSTECRDQSYKVILRNHHKKAHVLPSFLHPWVSICNSTVFCVIIYILHCIKKICMDALSCYTINYLYLFYNFPVNNSSLL